VGASAALHASPKLSDETMNTCLHKTSEKRKYFSKACAKWRILVFDPLTNERLFLEEKASFLRRG
jgi:hypothetical protein